MHDVVIAVWKIDAERCRLFKDDILPPGIDEADRTADDIMPGKDMVIELRHKACDIIPHQDGQRLRRLVFPYIGQPR